MLLAIAQTTVVQRLHPLIKIGCAAGITTAALSMNKPEALFVLLASVVFAMVLARVRLSSRTLFFMLAMCAVVAGGSFWASHDRSEAARYALRLAVVVLTVPFTATTTSPHDLVRGLARLRVPQGPLVATLVSWRFFPTIGRQVQEIREATLLRAGGGIGSWYRHLMLPLIAATLDDAERVAMALEGRGFDVDAERTWYRVPHLGMADAVSGLFAVGVIAAAIYLEWWRP